MKKKFESQGERVKREEKMDENFNVTKTFTYYRFKNGCEAVFAYIYIDNKGIRL